MATEPFILARDYCAYHHVEIDFVQVLAAQGLIETIYVEQSIYLKTDQLERLEKLTRLHQELSVHVDDLDIVAQLLERLETLQAQVTQLRNRLVFYEPSGDTRS